MIETRFHVKVDYEFENDDSKDEAEDEMLHVTSPDAEWISYGESYVTCSYDDRAEAEECDKKVQDIVTRYGGRVIS